jgi:two-component system, LytTR family, sensor kinase
MAKIISLDRQRFKIYLWIGAAYAFLWMFGDLVGKQEFFFKRVWNNIWLTTYLVVLNFVVYEYVFPFIKLRWKRLIVAPLILFVVLMFYSFGFYAWRGFGIRLHLYFELMKHVSAVKGLEYHIPYSLASIIFFGLMRHFYDYRKLKESAQSLQIQKQEAELNYLKSQTNPHFLFNTLNNIYSLARDKSDLAPESILRLSKILRFMLYETSGEYIAVEHELKIIDDYIALERLRYDDSLHVNITRDIEDMKQAVPPLLLIPLVENAFKHGVSETRDRPFVEIHLSINRRILTFVVRNSTDMTAERPVKENIGLSNLRRQLQLLYSDFSLDVQPGDAVFVATLKINLASHV